MAKFERGRFILGKFFFLDGKFIINANLTNCKIHIKTGEFGFFGQSSFEGCQFFFQDAAEKIANLVQNPAARPQA